MMGQIIKSFSLPLSFLKYETEGEKCTAGKSSVEMEAQAKALNEIQKTLSKKIDEWALNALAPSCGAGSSQANAQRFDEMTAAGYKLDLISFYYYRPQGATATLPGSA